LGHKSSPAREQNHSFCCIGLAASPYEDKPTVFPHRAGKMEYILSGFSFSLLAKLVTVAAQCWNFTNFQHQFVNAEIVLQPACLECSSFSINLLENI